MDKKLYYCSIDILSPVCYAILAELVDPACSPPRRRQFHGYDQYDIPDMMEKDQEFLDYVIKAIVNNPDSVKTTRTIDERGVLLTLDVSPTDMGYVIGRQGQTARAVRTLLKIVGAKNNARVNLKINEPVGGRGPRSFAHANEGGYGSAQSDVDVSAVDTMNI